MKMLLLALGAAGAALTLAAPATADDDSKPMATAEYPWCSATVMDHCTNRPMGMAMGHHWKARHAMKKHRTMHHTMSRDTKPMT